MVDSLQPAEKATNRPGQPADADKPRKRARTLDVGEVFGRYKLLERIGSGGMGDVFLALDLQLDRTVALKIPALYGEGAEKRLQRFFREAKAAAALSHPNLCQVYDVGEINGVHYLTMEHVDGKSLAKLMKNGRTFSCRQVAMLIRRLAKAMHVAHQAGIYHRDLKPSNIVVDQSGKPVIVDFGLAWRELGDDPKVTREGTAVGTPAFMSPEQIQHGMEATGAASDIYSLGVTCYFALTGRLPFTGKVPAIYVNIVNDAPVPPRVHNPQIPAALEAVCLKAMAKDPAERFPSMDALAKALGALLANWPEDVSAASPGAESSKVRLSIDDTYAGDVVFATHKSDAAALPPEIVRPGSNWPVKPSTLLTVAAGLLLGGGLAWWSRERSAPPSVVETNVDQASAVAAVPEPKPSTPVIVEPPAAEALIPQAVASQVDDPPGKPERAASVPADLEQGVQPPRAEAVEEKSAPTVEPLRDPQEVLAQVGLVKLSRTYSLSLESEFLNRLQALDAVKGEVKKARSEAAFVEEKEKLRETQIFNAQKEWRRLEPLQEEARRANNARKYNQIVIKRNELATKIKDLQSQKDDRALEAARHRLAQAVSKYQEATMELSQLASRIESEYASLATDAAVQNALKSLQEEEPTPVKPSRAYERAQREFKEQQQAMLRWEVPARRDGSKIFVEARLNERLTVEMEYNPGGRWTMIPAALAARLGLRPSDADPKVMITLPDGSQYEGTKMQLSSVRVGLCSLPDVECIVFPDELENAAPKLGGSFLRHFFVQLEDEKLTFQPLDETATNVKRVTTPPQDR